MQNVGGETVKIIKMDLENLRWVEISKVSATTGIQ